MWLSGKGSERWFCTMVSGFCEPNHTLSKGNGPQNDIFFYIFAKGFKNKHTESILLVMLTIYHSTNFDIHRSTGTLRQILGFTGGRAECVAGYQAAFWMACAE